MSDLRKAAQDALDALKDRIVRIHTASLDGRPKQAYGEMVYAMTQMQEWETLRAALATCPDCGKPTPPDSVHTCSPQVVPDVPYPGMQEAFESHFGQSWKDGDWRGETSTWAAAWKVATRAALQQPAPDCNMGALCIGCSPQPDECKPDPMQTIHDFGREQEAREDAVCEWTAGNVYNKDYWSTSCGNAHAPDEGQPPLMGVKYCYHCGKRIRFIDAANQGEQ